MDFQENADTYRCRTEKKFNVSVVFLRKLVAHLISNAINEFLTGTGRTLVPHEIIHGRILIILKLVESISNWISNESWLLYFVRCLRYCSLNGMSQFEICYYSSGGELFFQMGNTSVWRSFVPSRNKLYPFCRHTKAECLASIPIVIIRVD